jgi:transposase-like protein
MPKYNNPRKAWRYPDDFKSKTVQLTLLRDIRIKEVARIYA